MTFRLTLPRTTRQSQPTGFNLTYVQMPAPLVRVSLCKYDIRFQTVRVVTVRARLFRASARTRGNATEHPQDRQNTRRTDVHREAHPSKAHAARSQRRARARRAIRVQDALSRGDSSDQPILGQLRSSVILVTRKKYTTFQIHHIAPSANVTFRLTLPRTNTYT